MAAIPPGVPRLQNEKPVLARFLQGHLGRPLSNEDVGYVTSQMGSIAESVVTLRCLRGEMYHGQGLAESKAEDAAARAALEAHGAELGCVAELATAAAADLAARTSGMPRPPRGTSKRSRKVKDPGQPPSAEPQTPKKSLADFLQRILGRALTRSDMVYSTKQDETTGLCRATLVLMCMNHEVFSGKACMDLKQAEHSAAQQALDSHHAEVTEVTELTAARRLLETQHAPASQHLLPAPAAVPAWKQLIKSNAPAPAPLAMTVAKRPTALGPFKFDLPTLHRGIGGTERLTTAEPFRSVSAGANPVRTWATKLFAPNASAPVLNDSERPKKLKRIRMENPMGAPDPGNKHKLYRFMQVHIGRGMIKSDIEFTGSAEDGFCVSLHCLGGLQFFGAPASDEKSGHEAAAAVALEAFAEDVAKFDLQPSRRGIKREIAAADVLLAEAEAEAQAATMGSQCR